MTVDEAKKEIGDTVEAFCKEACNLCNSEWYCPTHCDLLEKAKQLEFNRILKCYARNDGDMRKVFRYVRTTKIHRAYGGY